MMEFTCKAILFDLDGVLINSSAVINRHWKRWAERHDIPFEKVTEVYHGRTSTEIIQIVAPHLNAIEEGRLRENKEGSDTDGLEVYTSARLMINELPKNRWAIVTSGKRSTATVRLNFGGFPFPKALISSDDVEFGKPHPEPYLTAAQRLGVSAEECIVIEDAPAGLLAAHGAKMRVIAVTTTLEPDLLTEADAIIRDLEDLQLTVSEDHLHIQLKNLNLSDLFQG